MNRIMEKLDGIAIRGSETGLSSQTALQRMSALAASFLMPFMMLTGSAAATYDSSDDITHSITDGMSQVFGVLRTLSVPVATVALVLCGYYIFTGGEKGMEKAKKIALYTGLGVGIVWLGPIAITSIAAWFRSSSDGNSAFDKY